MNPKGAYFALVLILAGLWSSGEAKKHHKKAKTKFEARSCQVNTHGQEVVPAGEAFTLTCTFNLEPEICTWHHDNPVDSGLPLDEEDATPTNNFDVLCSQVREKGETLCKGHRRISFDASGDGQKGRKSTTMTKVGRYLSKRTKKASKKKKKHRSHLKKLKSVRKSCTLRVSATTAEDAGEWRLEAMAMVDKHKMSHLGHAFRVRTANASSLSVELNGDRVDGGVDVDDSAFFSPGDWVEARAVAIGGRPRPTLKWTVDGKEPGSQYKVIHQPGRCLDRQDLVCEDVSTLVFQVGHGDEVLEEDGEEGFLKRPKRDGANEVQELLLAAGDNEDDDNEDDNKEAEPEPYFNEVESVEDLKEGKGEVRGAEKRVLRLTVVSEQGIPGMPVEERTVLVSISD